MKNILIIIPFGIFSLAMTVGGVFLICRSRGPERDNSISITTFFAFLTVFFIISLIESVRLQRQLKLKAVVSLPTGRRLTTRNWKIMGLVASLLFLGIVMGLYTHFNLILKFIGWFIAAVGAASLILFLMRTSSLTFTPDGVMLSGPGYIRLVGWDNIVNLQMISVSGNPAIGYDLHSLEDLVPGLPAGGSTEDPTLIKIAKAATFCRRVHGCQFYIMPGIYGADAGYLFRAMERYIMHPDARAELRARDTLPLSL
jgi:hypothetical protein